jgi:hypothetical protein
MFIALLWLGLTASSLYAQSQSSFERAVEWTLGPSRNLAEYQYIMTARIRPLFFWIGADDVGGGYIRTSTLSTDESVRLIEVVFGSDPAKAPRKINHWGAATEAMNGRQSAFFGFMKTDKAGSANDADAEIQRQKKLGKYAFEAIISTVEPVRAFSRVVPLLSDTDFSLHQLEDAKRLIAQRLEEGRSVRQLNLSDERCQEGRGFLQAVEQLIGKALEGNREPSSLCFVYNARTYTIRLERKSRVSSKQIRVNRKNGPKIERTYRDLIQAEFTVIKQESKQRTTFELLAGTTGVLRGVPVQITHQPRWWFQVILNLQS